MFFRVTLKKMRISPLPGALRSQARRFSGPFLIRSACECFILLSDPRFPKWEPNRAMGHSLTRNARSVFNVVVSIVLYGWVEGNEHERFALGKHFPQSPRFIFGYDQLYQISHAGYLIATRFLFSMREFSSLIVPI